MLAAVLWVTGAVPLPVTALLVPVALTAFGVYPDLGDAVAGFADPVVFLLLAGLVLAEALRAHGIDRRVAFHVLARMGTSPRRLVLGVMVATALLSMAISNTATAAMMAPIAVGVAAQVTGRPMRQGAGVGEAAPGLAMPADGSVADAHPSAGGQAGAGDPADERTGAGDASAGAAGSGDGRDAEPEPTNFEVAMLLGVAYAASVGGVGTLIGTPPNAIVYGTGRVGRAQMLRAGVLFDALMAGAVTAAALVLARTLWPLVPGRTPRVAGRGLRRRLFLASLK